MSNNVGLGKYRNKGKPLKFLVIAIFSLVALALFSYSTGGFDSLNKFLHNIDANYQERVEENLINKYMIWKVTKLIKEEKVGLLSDGYNYLVIAEYGEKVKTFSVSRSTYYSLKVGDIIDYKGRKVDN